MKNFADRLTERITELNNPTVMGLDPLIEYIPEFLLQKKLNNDSRIGPRRSFRMYMPSEPSTVCFDISAEIILEFNKMLIDSIKDIIPAVKPQIAYYELFGKSGIQAYIETIEYAKKQGLIVIADAKRNDIGSTAVMYSKAFLGKTTFFNNLEYSAFDADALTVNAYLGIDGIIPFIDDCRDNGKGIFILVRTSNPSASDFQDIVTESGEHLYEIVARKVDEWGKEMIGASGYSSVGAVVGATWPEQAKIIREKMPSAMILVPGYGAQGGTGNTVAACFGSDGKGAIVNASRSLMLAYRKEGYSQENFQEATYKEALRMKDDLNNCLSNA